MTTWRGAQEPTHAAITSMGWFRIAARGGLLCGLFMSGIALLMLARLIERPIWRMHGPLAPWVPMLVFRAAIAIIGIRYRIEGRAMRRPGALVANHSSWLDIPVLNAGKPVYFVAKSEVAEWPFIGWLARAVGTVFITRSAREAAAQKLIFEKHLAAGHRLLFFPEGTSTDGSIVLPFKSSLYEAFFTSRAKDGNSIQPVTVQYSAPAGKAANFFGWWGDMAFGPHFLSVLAASPQGAVTLVYHEPLNVGDFADRKELAAACEAVVRSGFDHLNVGSICGAAP